MSLKNAKIGSNALEMATLAAGCFWCTEAIFKRLKGVVDVVPGYSGGQTKNPSYDEVCSGTTGHAEAIQITFDPTVISYDKILDVFWHLHDPTTPNQQGADIGPQYRSAIFYHSAKQKEIATELKNKLGKSGTYSKPIVTQIVPFSNFYKAEDYHLNYYDRNKSAPYCQIAIDPKIQKLMANYKQDVKEEYKTSIT
ncbi:MAG: peptide-methionine (S)-S-oxide reductase MsrA [Patescibacteria group bacterium]